MNNNTAAIILAAGGSKRLGKPKQLLDWFGKTFIEQVVDNAIMAGLNPIIVVTGAFQKEVEAQLIGKDVIITRNNLWEDGQSGSLIAGLRALQDSAERPFIFILCDQPQTPVELIKLIVNEVNNTEVDIVTTMVNGKTCPPILFKPVCVPELLELKGDQGGKGLLKSHQYKEIRWEDVRLLLDVDTEEDYVKIIDLYSKNIRVAN